MTQENSRLDRIDTKILKLLRKDGRMSWSQLATEVSLSASAVQRRTESLVERGIIRNFTVNLDESALGNGVKAFVEVNVDRQNLEEAEEFRRNIRQLPQVQACHMISGSIDFMLEVVAKDVYAFGDFLESELLRMPAVKDASSSFVLKLVKPKEVMIG